MLAIARGLMGKPKLMLLDEPSTGLAPTIVDEISRIIKVLQEEGRTILLVEQNALMATSIAQFYYIIRDGQIAKKGPTNSIPENLTEFFSKYYI